MPADELPGHDRSGKDQGRFFAGPVLRLVFRGRGLVRLAGSCCRRIFDRLGRSQRSVRRICYLPEETSGSIARIVGDAVVVSHRMIGYNACVRPGSTPEFMLKDRCSPAS